MLLVFNMGRENDYSHGYASVCWVCVFNEMDVGGWGAINRPIPSFQSENKCKKFRSLAIGDVDEVEQ